MVEKSVFERELKILLFEDYEDFKCRAKEIAFSYKVIIFCPFFNLRDYKNYVYGKKMFTKRKDFIWEYLNGDITIDELTGEYYKIDYEEDI